MKKTLLLLAFLCTFSGAIQAQESTFSLGADLIGSQISADYDLSERASIRADLDFLLLDANVFIFSPTLIFHKIDNSIELGESGGSLVPYHGPGLIFGYNGTTEEATLGLHFPWGLEYHIVNAPFEVFLDAGPAIEIEPRQLFYLTSSFGVRYQF